MREQAWTGLPTQAGTRATCRQLWPRYWTSAVDIASVDVSLHISLTGFKQMLLRARFQAHGRDVVTGFGLRFGRDGHERFCCIGCDGSRSQPRLFLFSPFIDGSVRSMFAPGTQ